MRFATFLHTVRLASLAMLAGLSLSLALAPREATGHSGHDHNLVPEIPATAAPRADATSADFEVVVAAATGRLLVYVDDFATNEPVSGAKVEIIEGDETSQASEINPGIYAVAGWTRPPGEISLTVAIDTAALSDLLPVSLRIPLPADPAAMAVPPTVWIIVGQTAAVAAVALLLLLIYARSRRRYDFLLESGSRFSSTALLVSAQRPESIETVRTLRIGPSLVAERLWEETGCAQAIADAAQRRRFGFPAERVVYASVLHRMFGTEPGRSVSEWLEDHQVPGMSGLDERQVNIAMAWLGKDAGEPARAERPARTTKDLIEERLFAQRADAEAGLDLVFFNTVPVTLEARGTTRGKPRGPQAQQVAVGVVIDANRRPVCFELWPGGALDVESLLPAIDRLRARFDIRRVCLVADLRIADPATIGALEARGLHFILGMRDGSGGLRARILADTRPLEPVRVARPRGGLAELRVKEVSLAAGEAGARERFIVYGGGKDGPAEAPETAGDETAQYVLRTNTGLSPAETVMRYRQLLSVEETFRDAKAILDMQSVPRARDAVVRGHMFCSFLALLLRRELEERLTQGGASVAWREVVRDLNRLAEVEVQQDDRRFLLRTRPQGAAAAALAAVGVTAPPAVERRFEGDGALIDAQAVDAAPWDRVRNRALTLTEVAVIQAAQNFKALGDWVSRQK